MQTLPHPIQRGEARRIVTDPALCAARPSLAVIAWAVLRGTAANLTALPLPVDEQRGRA